MKTYSTDIQNMVKIRAIFQGYIFRRTENGIGYVKCSDRAADTIKRFGITLTEVQEE